MGFMVFPLIFGKPRLYFPIIVGLALSTSIDAGTAPENRAPIQAQLIRVVEAGRINVGDSILAKVNVQWQNPDCLLRRGAILKGRIVAASVRSKTSKTSEIALMFESGECGGKEMKPLPLTVAAVIAPDQSLNSDVEHQSLSEAVGVGIDGGMRSAQYAAATTQYEPPRHKGPKAVMPGQVIGIHGLKLAVGGGQEGSSILSSSKRTVRLEPGSQLVLVPALKPPTTTAYSSAPPSTGPATPSVGEIKTPDTAQTADNMEICTPPDCTSTLTANEAETGTASATATVAIRELGFPMRAETREMHHFDYDAALTYLGPRKLLFTFNPHQLVRRTGAEAESKSLHAIRGILFNLQTMKVEQTLEWRVPDAGQYLWQVGTDKALIHIGRELRLYGPELKVEQKVSLDGQLAFVAISPSGTYFAVGVVHERHSGAIHQQLLESEEREPEEDVEVRALNMSFKTLASVLRSSRDVPPALSDEGEIRTPAIGKNRWRIVEHSWDSQRRVIAQVNSTCMPTVKTLPSRMLFVVGCDWQTDGKWYRVLRSDGKPVLKGWSPSAELAQTAIAARDIFAIRTAKATKAMATDAVFRTSDLEAEHIVVCRSRSGQRLLAVTLPSPVPTLQTFVLSPGGDQLAVLSQDQIAFYPLPMDH
jgi:hypothetical protein